MMKLSFAERLLVPGKSIVWIEKNVQEWYIEKSSLLGALTFKV